MVERTICPRISLMNGTEVRLGSTERAASSYHGEIAPLRRSGSKASTRSAPPGRQARLFQEVGTRASSVIAASA